MNKHYLLIGLIATIAGTLSMQQPGHSEIVKFNKRAHKSSGGAGPGKTGAPGEQNCTACHSGTAQDGSTENVFTLLEGINPVTSYLPGQTYTASLVMASNPSKKGFQSIVLDGTNSMAGNFTAATTTAISTSGSKKYANHKSTSNTSATPAWTWTWSAPASDVGNVTFYIASNKANNNGTSSGDIIYLSQHIITSEAGLVEQTKEESDFTAGYNAEGNKLHLSFNSLVSGDLTLNLVDMNGRSVFFSELGQTNIGKNQTTIKLPSDLRNGIYAANVFVGNKAMSAKIMVQK